MHTWKKIFKAHPGLSGHASFDPKWPICPNQNFFWKNHYDFHVPLGPFQYAKFKKNLYSRFGALRMHYNFESKMAQLPKPGNFFEKIPFGSCYCSKLEKKSHQKEVTPFLGPKLPIGPKWYCFWKNHWPNFHVPLGPFLMQNFKKSLEWIQKYENAPFFGPKWPFCLKREFFFRKLFSQPCCVHSCLSTCKKYTSDVNWLMRYTTKEYWNLIGRERFWP